MKDPIKPKFPEKDAVQMSLSLCDVALGPAQSYLREVMAEVPLLVREGLVNQDTADAVSVAFAALENEIYEAHKSRLPWLYEGGEA